MKVRHDEENGVETYWYQDWFCGGEKEPPRVTYQEMLSTHG